MYEWALASQIALWIVVAVQAVILLVVVRQVGILNVRVMRGGIFDPGPEPGDAAPSFDLVDMSDASVRIEMPPPNGRPVLLVFVTPICPVCQSMSPEIVRLYAETRDRLAWVVLAFGEELACREFRESHNLASIPFCHAPESVWQRFGLRGVPYGILVDHSGVIRARSPIGSEELLDGVLRLARVTG